MERIFSAEGNLLATDPALVTVMGLVAITGGRARFHKLSFPGTGERDFLAYGSDSIGGSGGDYEVKHTHVRPSLRKVKRMAAHGGFDFQEDGADGDGNQGYTFYRKVD